VKAPDVQEARDRFELAENESDPAAKLEALEAALALVDEILDEPGVSEADRQVTRNMRRTYLRRLIEQLVRVAHVQFSDWFGYMRLLLVDQRAVVGEIVEADPALNARYRAFIALWSRQFREALGQDIETFINKG
jgi:hypothetical protein